MTRKMTFGQTDWLFELTRHVGDVTYNKGHSFLKKKIPQLYVRVFFVRYSVRYRKENLKHE